MSEDLILLRREPPLAWVTVNRPAARNALNAAMWRGLSVAFESLAANHEIRVIILTGAGEQAFIAGQDLAEMQLQNADPFLSEASIAASLAGLHAITQAPQPVIAAINGACIGGGVLIAATCDLRWCAASARLAVTAAKIGVAYPYEEGVLPLIRLVGKGRAADLLFSGRMVNAEEALQMGLVNRVVADQDLVADVTAYALELARNAPLSLTAHKRALQMDEDVAAHISRCYASADHREGLAAFLEKRSAVFEGK